MEVKTLDWAAYHSIIVLSSSQAQGESCYTSLSSSSSPSWTGWWINVSACVDTYLWKLSLPTDMKKSSSDSQAHPPTQLKWEMRASFTHKVCQCTVTVMRMWYHFRVIWDSRWEYCHDTGSGSLHLSVPISVPVFRVSVFFSCPIQLGSWTLSSI